MSDRELLEKAAKAAGIELIDYCTKVAICFYDKKTQTAWNPLTKDGDALRLAVRLALTIQCACVDDYGREYVRVDHYPNSGEPATVSIEEYGCDESATRRAIVRAAAAMGEKHE